MTSVLSIIGAIVALTLMSIIAVGLAVLIWAAMVIAWAKLTGGGERIQEMVRDTDGRTYRHTTWKGKRAGTEWSVSYRTRTRRTSNGGEG